MTNTKESGQVPEANKSFNRIEMKLSLRSDAANGGDK